MVVPARGGMGRAVETQANTLAAEIARKLGGHHRLMHIPDHMDAAAMQEMLKLPEIRETIELLQRADVILHGIGRADEMAKHRHLSVSLTKRLLSEGAVAEAFGYYFDREGKCLYTASSVGVDLGRLKPNCLMIAVAAGERKAEAMIAVLRHYRHEMLVTDEGAARKIIALLS
jgi:central glycolytic genes regulator